MHTAKHWKVSYNIVLSLLLLLSFSSTRMSPSPITLDQQPLFEIIQTRSLPQNRKQLKTEFLLFLNLNSTTAVKLSLIYYYNN
jgi:hypothetical protein